MKAMLNGQYGGGESINAFFPKSLVLTARLNHNIVIDSNSS